MAIHSRREREREARHNLIIEAARELAEAEGWEVVTTRRLAERIEYSQPVLYSHFTNKQAIVTAVAVRGFADLADALATARATANGAAPAWAAVATAYVEFGYANPALYDAMFTLTTDLPFGDPTAPEPLRAGFSVLRDTLAPLAVGRDVDTFTELAWSSLHGMVTLTRNGRLRADLEADRQSMIIELLLPASRPSETRYREAGGRTSSIRP